MSISQNPRKLSIHAYREYPFVSDRFVSERTWCSNNSSVDVVLIGSNRIKPGLFVRLVGETLLDRRTLQFGMCVTICFSRKAVWNIVCHRKRRINYAQTPNKVCVCMSMFRRTLRHWLYEVIIITKGQALLNHTIKCIHK